MATYQVAIIGGGSVGLVASILLSQQSIPHLLFERYPSTSIHPKACGLNQRTAEIFNQMGVLPEILKHRAPPQTVSRTAWYTSLGPNGKEILTRDSWGGNQYAGEYERVSPCPYLTLAQIRLEPILLKRAILLNPAGIHHNASVKTVEELEDRVILTVDHKDKPEPTRYAFRYVIGADGGRVLTESLGIKWEGERDIVNMISAHFKAPISKWHPDPSVFISWFINPLLGGSIGTGYLYHIGPWTGNESEEWVFACALNPNDPKCFEEKDMIERINSTLQIPNLKIELQSLSHWYVNAIVAERYRSRPFSGRIFLVGDAAHRIPPWGALGLNSGIQDIHNLVWKLEFALHGSTEGEDYNGLLDSYDTERRPVGQRVAKTSLHNLRSHSSVMDRALGILPMNSTSENVKAMEAFLNAKNPAGESTRNAVVEAQKILDNEFHALGAEIGWFYPSVDVDNEGEASRHDGQILENGDLDCINYHPSTIPGHHLPHSWLISRAPPHKISTRDLVMRNRILLLTSDEESWLRYESKFVGVDIIRHDGKPEDGRYNWDVDGTWAKVCGISKTGAVIVRPDGIVAWRAYDSRGMTSEKFQEVVRRIFHLDRSRGNERQESSTPILVNL